MFDPNQIVIVQNTYLTFASNAHRAGKLFYDRLFEIDPTLKPLFKGDMDAQAVKLMQMVGTAVSALRKPNLLNDAVSELGRRHVGYGVKAEHYQVVGEALLYAIKTQLKDGFTADVEAAWRTVYSELARISIEAGGMN
ncbi:MAG: globin domain-containing protein [Anaerolineae bacterium]|nr:globin domain-containing protein [Anaerolineae bacterium]